MGTITVSCVAVAEDTVALVAPKNTMLLDGVRLKLDPVIVTDVLMEPLFGVNDEIDGICPFTGRANTRFIMAMKSR